jgi:hypothetical protein
VLPFLLLGLLLSPCRWIGRRDTCGACARGGGFEVGLDWKRGVLARAMVRLIAGQPGRVCYQNATAVVDWPRGGTITPNSNLRKL